MLVHQGLVKHLWIPSSKR